MQITDNQTDEQSLADLGTRAAGLLRSGDFDTLADQFGYAVSFERDPASAIREDLSSSLAELGAPALGSSPSPPASVSYFESHADGLCALVEQRIPASNGRQVLLELVVSAQGIEKHVVLEQISAAD
ncbi:hypothetical protein ACFJIW_11850 [Tahibacter sp. UC22_41]|uniref:hypothetical protein n=1 Tax=Tahibacter sp. UC22_41 TaxID=3350178 RepID=UPI0036DEF259